MVIIFSSLLLGMAFNIDISASSKILEVCPSKCAHRSIQSAIDVANNGDIILVNAGTYRENIDLRGKSITIKSQPGPKSTIIDGLNLFTTVSFKSQNSAHGIIEGFTIRNGYGRNGGGIHCEGVSLKLNNIIVSNNTSTEDGGGMYCRNSTVKITDSKITKNTSKDGDGGGAFFWNSSVTIFESSITENKVPSEKRWGGGGLSILEGSSFQLKNNYIARNKASFGAGIYVKNSKGQIRNNTVTGNETYGPYDTVSASGGGIMLDPGSSAVVEDNVIKKNKANDGGGIHIEDYSLIVNNSISQNIGGGVQVFRKEGTPLIVGNKIVENEATDDGGGITVSRHAKPVLINNFIGYNKAPNHGGGIFGYDHGNCFLLYNTILNNNAGIAGNSVYLINESDLAAINTILWNRGADVIRLASNNSQFTARYSVIKGGWGGIGVMAADPGFIREGDYHINSSSPCIDSGEDGDLAFRWLQKKGLPLTLEEINSFLSYDIDEDPRPANKGYDIGADECTKIEPEAKKREKKPSTEFYSLQQSIREAEPGDIIEVEPGTYTENILIDKSITLRGLRENKPLIKGIKEGQSVINVKSIDKDTQVNIENIRIGFAPENGIQAGGQAKLELINVEIVGNGSNGVEASSQTELHITDSQLSNNGLAGIEFYDSAKVVITSSTLSHNSDKGIWAHDSVLLKVEDSKIQGNSDGGIYLYEEPEGFPKVTVLNCKITDNGGCGIYAENENTIASCVGNTVEKNDEGSFCGEAVSRCK